MIPPLKSGIFNLTSAATVYAATIAEEVVCCFDIEVGGASGALDSGESELTVVLTIGGLTRSASILKATGRTGIMRSTDAMRLPMGASVSVTLLSTNSSDTSVFVTVRPTLKAVAYAQAKDISIDADPRLKLVATNGATDGIPFTPWSWGVSIQTSCTKPGYYDATSNRTYFAYMSGVGYGTAQTFGVYVTYLDHATGAWAVPFSLGTVTMYDDHAEPSVCVLADGRILVEYGAHSTPMYFKISTNAHDLTAWGTETAVVPANAGGQAWNANFPCVFCIGDYVYFLGLCKYGSSAYRLSYVPYCVSTATFGNSANITGDSGWNPLPCIDYVRGVLHVFLDGAADADVHYFSGTISNGTIGTWIGADGTALTAPIAIGAHTQIYEGGARWAYLMGAGASVDSGGYPMVAWNAARELQYKFCRKTSSGWGSAVTICPASGNRFQYAILVADSDTTLRAYVFSGAGFTGWDSPYNTGDTSEEGRGGWVQEYVSTDSGATWRLGSRITAGMAYTLAGVEQSAADGQCELFICGGDADPRHIFAWGRNAVASDWRNGATQRAAVAAIPTAAENAAATRATPIEADIVLVKGGTFSLDSSVQATLADNEANRQIISENAGGSGSAGTGSVSKGIVTQIGGVAVPGVAVWITSDAAGVVAVAGPLVSDAFGRVVFDLDPGSYYVWRQLSGKNFTNPDKAVLANVNYITVA